MTQQVSLLSLTSQARVQSQHNLYRICGTYIVIGTLVFFSNPSVFPCLYHYTAIHIYLSAMNFI